MLLPLTVLTKDVGQSFLQGHHICLGSAIEGSGDH